MFKYPNSSIDYELVIRYMQNLLEECCRLMNKQESEKSNLFSMITASHSLNQDIFSALEKSESNYRKLVDNFDDEVEKKVASLLLQRAQEEKNKSPASGGQDDKDGDKEAEDGSSDKKEQPWKTIFIKRVIFILHHFSPMLTLLYNFDTFFIFSFHLFSS